jgi:hypothetical protein
MPIGLDFLNWFFSYLSGRSSLSIVLHLLLPWFEPDAASIIEDQSGSYSTCWWKDDSVDRWTTLMVMAALHEFSFCSKLCPCKGIFGDAWICCTMVNYLRIHGHQKFVAWLYTNISMILPGNLYEGHKYSSWRKYSMLLLIHIRYVLMYHYDHQNSLNAYN